MRGIVITYPSVVWIAVLLFYSALFGLLLTSNTIANTDSLSMPIETRGLYKARGKLVLDCKTYIKRYKPRYTHRARQITIQCINLSTDSRKTYESKSGKLDLVFAIDTRYLVYVSKDGYETKMLAFSTKGADPTETYKFDFDLLLEKSGKATYDEFTPSTYIVYNRLQRMFFYKRFLFRASLNR